MLFKLSDRVFQQVLRDAQVLVMVSDLMAQSGDLPDDVRIEALRNDPGVIGTPDTISCSRRANEVP